MSSSPSSYERNNQPEIADDEIDLHQLLDSLLLHKKLILKTIVVALIIGCVHLLIHQPTYKAQTSFLPPSVSDISTLNVDKVYEASVGNLYREFEIQLNSREVYEKAFSELVLDQEYTEISAGEKDQLLESFSKDIVFSKFKADKKSNLDLPILYLAVSYQSAEEAANLANEIVKNASLVVLEKVRSNVQARIKLKKKILKKDIEELKILLEKNIADEIVRIEEKDSLNIKNLNDQIAALRAEAKLKRLNEVQRLKEADLLALEAINEKIRVIKSQAKEKRLDRLEVLKESLKVASGAALVNRMTAISSVASQQPAVYTELNTQAQPLYLRGEKELSSEIKALEERLTDEPFIAELAELEKQRELLKDNEKIRILMDRKSDDPFIEQLPGLKKELKLLEVNRQVEILRNRKSHDAFVANLREKEQELRYLDGISLDTSTARVAVIDRLATPPLKAEGMGKLVKLILFIIVGLFLGVIFAFMKSFWQEHQKRKLLS